MATCCYFAFKYEILRKNFSFQRCRRKFHNEEKCAFYTSLILLGCFRPEGNNGHRIAVEKCGGGKLLERPIDRIIMLKCTLKK